MMQARRAARLKRRNVPSGVILAPIDGGSNYYAKNSFTFATRAGWDDPGFFPISGFLQPCGDQGSADNLIDRGINTLISVQAGDADLQVMRNNDLSLVVQADELATILTGNGGSLGSETVGINVFDEPTTYQEAIGAIETVANVHQDQRYLYENYTHNALTFADIEGHAIPDLLDDEIETPNATTRHLDIVGVDIYWFSGYNGADGGAFSSAFIYDRAILSNDERRRGARYGDMLDWMRLGNPIYDNAPFQEVHPAPTGVWIETGSPYTENNDTAQRITPAEFNASVWSTIIHGARIIKYFMHSFGSAGEDAGMASQMDSTATLVLQVASVLNSPFALGYVDVSPEGVPFNSAPPAAFKGDGFDVMAKYYNGKFYLFAIPRYSAAASNQVATFTIKNTGGRVATVINENRSISIASGTKFSDNFATGNTVHIYRID